MKMSYSKGDFEEIRPTIEAISEMEPGDRLWLRSLPRETLVHTRWLVYSYLNRNNLKPLFRVKVLGSDLLIIRKGSQVEPILERAPANESSINALVRENLTLDQAEFEAKINKLPLTEEEKKKAVERWKVVMA
jgi:hypothetical protein